MRVIDKFDPRVNVKVLVIENGRVVAQRRTHNVMTNSGRNWLMQLLGSSDYAQSPPTAHTTAKLKYVGFGCGGVLQSDPAAQGFLNKQAEIASVVALEDPVPLSVAGTVKTFLGTLNDQRSGTIHFPGIGRTVFIRNVLETEISFAGNVTKGSNVVVGTEVPISEAGLYLSTATPTYDSANPGLGGDPVAANSLAAYNLFDPVVVTPSVSLRIEWEIRV